MAIPSNLPQPTYIQGLFHLDEASGNALDASVNANTLTETGGTIGTIAGQIGTARDFVPADTESFQITDASQTGLDITGEISVTGWVYGDNFGATRTIACKWNTAGNLECWRFHIAASKVSAEITPDGSTQVVTTSADTISTGGYNHVAFTLNQSTDLVQIYIAGLANGSAVSYTTDIADKNTPFEIGALNNNGTNYWDGRLDEVIVWNKCLTASEMLAVKNITAYNYFVPRPIGIGSPMMI